MLKKSTFLAGCLCLLLALPGGAAIPGKKPPKAKKAVAARLNRQVTKNYLRACNSQMKNSAIRQWPGPAFEFAPKGKNLTDLEGWKGLYANKNNLSPGMTAKHFLSEHNLQIVKWFPKLEQLRREVENTIPQFQAEKESVRVRADGDMKWLAKQITPDTKYVLFGEIHVAVIADQIKELLQVLHKQHIERPVLLFTEFLPEGKEWTPDTDESLVYRDNIPLFQTAFANGVKVVGLEIKQPYHNSQRLNERFLDGFSQEEGAGLWETIEGVRLRNSRWIKTLENYREQYPDALFVVHAGTGHVEYSAPYSLGRYFAGKETLVVDVLPMMIVHPETGEYTPLVSQFDFWTDGAFVQDRVLKFNSPRLAHLAGFDIRILSFALGYVVDNPAENQGDDK